MQRTRGAEAAAAVLGNSPSTYWGITSPPQAPRRWRGAASCLGSRDPPSLGRDGSGVGSSCGVGPWGQGTGPPASPSSGLRMCVAPSNPPSGHCASPRRRDRSGGGHQTGAARVRRSFCFGGRLIHSNGAVEIPPLRLPSPRFVCLMMDGATYAAMTDFRSFFFARSSNTGVASPLAHWLLLTRICSLLTNFAYRRLFRSPESRF